MLGVKESFWGSFAGLLAEQLAVRRAFHVIYVAKGGVLQGQSSVWSVSHPTSYYIAKNIRGDQSCYREIRIDNPPRSGLEDVPMLAFIGIRPRLEARHVSVPSVIGQTKDRILDIDRADTVDIEVSHMASRIASANREWGYSCGYTALQFITDALNPHANVQVLKEVSSLSNMQREYYLAKSSAIWEMTRAVSAFCLVQEEERETTKDVWDLENQEIHELISDWSRTLSVFLSITRKRRRVPPSTVENILLRCRFAGFYCDDVSVFEIFKDGSEIQRLAPAAAPVIQAILSYYNPMRRRVAKTVDAEVSIMRRLSLVLKDREARPAGYTDFVMQSFYSQMASHTVEAGRTDFQSAGLKQCDKALASIDFLALKPRDRVFERLHLLRNKARIGKGQIETTSVYREAIEMWSWYMAEVGAIAEERFKSACKVHQLMCSVELANLEGHSSAEHKNEILSLMQSFRRSHPLSYWASTRIGDVAQGTT